MDYLYGAFIATYNLEVVELLPLPDEAGVQMLWRNPAGFNPKSGEYVKIRIPWLSRGGNEWHPFSIYLKESTKKGLRLTYSNRRFSRNSIMDHEGETVKPLKEYINEILTMDLLENSIQSRYIEEARIDLRGQYNTTQVFICPVGDWTKNLMKELSHQKQLRACWVRGPYTSPYTVAQNFSHLVLTATGIGITPALGVLGQYPGFSRTKIFIWSTRDRKLLQFFAPLITDAHLSIIYYTGKQKFNEEQLLELSSHGNIYIQQSRPKSFTESIETVICEFENNLHGSCIDSIKELDMMKREAWCLLYCGGSKRIQNDLKSYSKINGLGFESELFDW